MMADDGVAELTHYRTGATINFTEEQLARKWRTWEDKYGLGGVHKVELECWFCEAAFVVMAKNPHLLNRPRAFGGFGKSQILCKRCYNRVNKKRIEAAQERKIKL